jgi:hypothetical protein
MLPTHESVSTSEWAACGSSARLSPPAVVFHSSFSFSVSDFRQLYTAFGVLFVIIAGIMIITIISTFCLMSGIANANDKKNGGGKKKPGKR